MQDCNSHCKENSTSGNVPSLHFHFLHKSNLFQADSLRSEPLEKPSELPHGQGIHTAFPYSFTLSIHLTASQNLSCFTGCSHWHEEGRSTEAKKKNQLDQGLLRFQGTIVTATWKTYWRRRVLIKNCPPIPQNLNYCGILGIRIFINMLGNSHMQLRLKHCDIAKIMW